MKVLAVVLAAGRGTRFGGATAKQFATLGGHPVVSYSVRAFNDHAGIDEVWVVGPADQLDVLRSATGGQAARYVAGGSERTDSVRAAISEARGGHDRVLIHDAARPLLSAEVISRVVDALDAADAVATVLPVVDTVVEMEGDLVARTPDRSAVFALQTPQGFDTEVLAEALSQSARRRFTDDVSMVANLVPGARTATVTGDPLLQKVTTPLDLAALEAWIRGGFAGDGLGPLPA